MLHQFPSASNSYDLAAIRAAIVVRITAWHAKAERHREPEGMPCNLWNAMCWLVHNGWEGEPCAAELACHETPRHVRMFLAQGDPSSNIEAGRRAIFEGRHPIYRQPVCAQDAAILRGPEWRDAA